MFEGIFESHKDVMEKARNLLINEIQKSADILLNAAKEKRTVFACGNGGSAADSQHFVGEFVGHYKKERGPLAAIALTSNTSNITAIGNDYGFEHIFSRQLAGLAKENDVLVAFSTSGGSSNVLEAIKMAKSLNMKIIVMTGERGAGLKEMSDAIIVAPSSDVGRIQEVHELVYHMWCQYIDEHLS